MHLAQQPLAETTISEQRAPSHAMPHSTLRHFFPNRIGKEDVPAEFDSSLRVDSEWMSSSGDPGHAHSILPAMMELPSLSAALETAANLRAASAMRKLLEDSQKGLVCDVAPLLRVLDLDAPRQDNNGSWTDPGDITEFLHALATLLPEVFPPLHVATWMEIDKQHVETEHVDLPYPWFPITLRTFDCLTSVPGTPDLDVGLLRDVLLPLTEKGYVAKVSNDKANTCIIWNKNTEGVRFVPGTTAPKEERVFFVATDSCSLLTNDTTSHLSFSKELHLPQGGHLVTQQNTKLKKVNERREYRLPAQTPFFFVTVNVPVSMWPHAPLIQKNEMFPSTASISETIFVAGSAYSLRYVARWHWTKSGRAINEGYRRISSGPQGLWRSADDVKHTVSSEQLFARYGGIAYIRVLLYTLDSLPNPVGASPLPEVHTNEVNGECEGLCIVCLAEPATFAMRTCKHLVYCAACQRVVIDNHRKTTGRHHDGRSPTQSLTAKQLIKYVHQCPICRFAGRMVQSRKCTKLYIP